jgi:hypothetical protein
MPDDRPLPWPSQDGRKSTIRTVNYINLTETPASAPRSDLVAVFSAHGRRQTADSAVCGTTKNHNIWVPYLVGQPQANKSGLGEAAVASVYNQHVILIVCGT